MFCILLFVLLSFLFWSLYYQSFFDLQLLITPSIFFWNIFSCFVQSIWFHVQFLFAFFTTKTKRMKKVITIVYILSIFPLQFVFIISWILTFFYDNCDKKIYFKIHFLWSSSGRNFHINKHCKKTEFTIAKNLYFWN
jgi:hypothetical protein